MRHYGRRMRPRQTQLQAPKAAPCAPQQPTDCRDPRSSHQPQGLSHQRDFVILCLPWRRVWERNTSLSNYSTSYCHPHNGMSKHMERNTENTWLLNLRSLQIKKMMLHLELACSFSAFLLELSILKTQETLKKQNILFS